MMPVVLVNPSRKRRGRKARKSRKTHRASAKRLKNPSRGRRRRRNPSSAWGDALIDVLLGGLGGGVAIGAAMGSEKIPVAPVWQMVIFGAAGLLGAVGVAKWGSKATGAGLLGGTIALEALRGIELYSLSKATAEARAALPPPIITEGASLFSARAVRESGAVGPGVFGAPASMAGNPLSPGFRTVPEAGYTSRYLPAGARLMGPRSWVNESGAVYRFRSAHNA